MDLPDAVEALQSRVDMAASSETPVSKELEFCNDTTGRIFHLKLVKSEGDVPPGTVQLVTN